MIKSEIAAAITAICLAVSPAAAAYQRFAANGASGGFNATAGFPYPDGGGYYLNVKSSIDVDINITTDTYFNYNSFSPDGSYSGGDDGVNTFDAGDFYDIDSYFGTIYIPPVPPGVMLYYPDGTLEFEEYFSGIDMDVFMSSSNFLPFDYSFSISSVPEPASWMINLLGAGAIGVTMRRRERRNA